MDAAEDGKIYRSDPITYGLGNLFTFKMDFLAGARMMAAPEIHEVCLEFSGSVTGSGGGALGVDAPKLFDNVRFTDEAEVINASGAVLHQLEQADYGSIVTDPATVAAAATNAAYLSELNIAFARPKAIRPRDFAVPLEHFLEGGDFSFATPAAAPTGWTVNSGVVRLKVLVKDGRKRELKSRWTIREQAMQNLEFDYDVGGSVIWVIASSKLTTTSYTDLSLYSSIYSRTLELPPNTPTRDLVRQYKRNSPSLASADPFVATTPLAIPIISANRWQKTGAAIDARTLHIDFTPSGQAAMWTGARLLVGAVKDRTPRLAALVAGEPTTEALARATFERGVIVNGNSDPSPVPKWAGTPTLGRRMPIRIK